MVEGLEELRRQLAALNIDAAQLKGLSAHSSGMTARKLRRAADRLSHEFRRIDALIDAASDKAPFIPQR